MCTLDDVHGRAERDKVETENIHGHNPIILHARMHAHTSHKHTHKHTHTHTIMKNVHLRGKRECAFVHTGNGCEVREARRIEPLESLSMICT